MAADTASASCSTLVSASSNNTDADNINVITSSYKLRKRNVTDHVQKFSSSSTPSKSKRFLWYEQKPFDDPVKEAKRMRSLYQKIYDDKRRFDYEILKEENRELREENEQLRCELKKLLFRESQFAQDSDSSHHESTDNCSFRDEDSMNDNDNFEVRLVHSGEVAGCNIYS